ncbi:MAG: sortase [Thermoleophilaceae bacterium]|jgi:sortase A|nr:sortase [Thermoleophilaceae bacterium]
MWPEATIRHDPLPPVPAEPEVDLSQPPAAPPPPRKPPAPPVQVGPSLESEVAAAREATRPPEPEPEPPPREVPPPARLATSLASEVAAARAGAPEPEAEAEAEPPPRLQLTALPPGNAAQSLAAFYDRRAPAALAYCARLCEPEAIADAVEEAFGHVFAAASSGAAPPSEEELDRRLRAAVRIAAARRAPRSGNPVEAERAYDALSGDDAPALGRSLLAEVLEGSPGTGQAAPAAAEDAGKRRRRHRLRPRPGWGRRIAIVLGVVGTLLVAEAAVTLAWKEPFTAYLTSQAQDDLDKQLGKQRVGLEAQDQRELAAITNTDQRTQARTALLASHLDAAVPEGDALGRIQIDRLGIDFVFVQGTEAATLRKGPGHYHGDTGLPGQGGTVGIAGHRTTYEAPFREIDELKAGDRITLRMPYGLFTYEVTGHRIVPADYRLAFAGGGASGPERLVLSACHPLYSATERILVEAKLVASEPTGAAVETSVPAVPLSAKDIARRRTIGRLKLLGDRQLGPGMTGRDVRLLQKLLGMPVTGTFDANTTAAVLAFQRDHGLPQVGVVGSQTKHLLAKRKHPPSRPPTPATVPQQQAVSPGTQQPGATSTGPAQTTP